MAILGPAAAFLKATPAISPCPPMSIAAWVKLPPSATGTNRYFQINGSNASDRFDLHFAGTPTPNTFGSNIGYHTGALIDASMVGNVSNTGWHLMTFLYDNGGAGTSVITGNVYHNAVFNTGVSGGGPAGPMPTDDSVSTGWIYSGNLDGGGTIAYPMIWKRLLTQAEITGLWNGGNGADPRLVAPSGLVSFVWLNQGTGTIADLVTPSIQWVVTGGTFTVAADPFTLAPYPPVQPPPITPSRYSSGWESGCGPADPLLSKISTTAYAGTGYGAVGSGEVGTINAGANTPVAPAGTPAQVRFFIGADGNLYAVGNQTAQTYLITGPVANPPPLIGGEIYSPTK